MFIIKFVKEQIKRKDCGYYESKAKKKHALDKYLGVVIFFIVTICYYFCFNTTVIGFEFSNFNNFWAIHAP